MNKALVCLCFAWSRALHARPRHYLSHAKWSLPGNARRSANLPLSTLGR